MARKARMIDETEVKALVAAEIADSILFQGTDITTTRARAMNYYNGVMTDTPADPNWSSFKSRDVSDVIGLTLPGIIRVFTASDRMVTYEPEQPGDEEVMEQASDYANFVFWRDNPGYRILWDATHDSLLVGDGIVKVYWDDTEKSTTHVYSGLDDAALGLLLSEDNVELVEKKKGDPVDLTGELGPQTNLEMPDENGEEIVIDNVIPTWDVKIKRKEDCGRIKIECVEPENFLKDRSSITLESARFLAHRDPHCTRSELVEMGFDPEIVATIPRMSAYGFMRPEELARAPIYGQSVGDESMDRITLYECYVKADINKDGVAETVLAYYAGDGASGTLLDWEVWDDEVPFVSIPCEPVPHRFESKSLASEVMDIQQIKTTLYRQLLNNTYQVNNPQKDIENGSVINMDELLNPTVGGVIIRKANSPPVNYNVVPSIMSEALEAINAMDKVTEMRTGISRATMMLDPTTLQNQTATASNNQKDASYSQIELIARNHAELGWKYVFRKILKLIVKHQDQERMIRLRDEWVKIDPRDWNSNMDAVVNVGLGTGSRDRDMSMLTNIVQSQLAMADRFQAAGMLSQAIDMIPKIVKTAVKIAESAGIKNAESFYPEIEEDVLNKLKQQAEQAPPQDPKVMAAQAKMQADMQLQQAQMQMDMQRTQAEMKMKQDETQAKFVMQQQQMAQEAELKRYQIDREMDLKREQLTAELALKREQLAAELELAAQTAVMTTASNHAIKSANIGSSVNLGGEPG